MEPPSPRERVAVIRALLAAVDAELDQLPGLTTAAGWMSAGMLQHLIEQNVCPECGINWREPSPTCPRIMFNRHILAKLCPGLRESLTGLKTSGASYRAARASA